ncbi:MAG: ZIP family metal transporter [Desulfobacterales bacterium]|nr:ZIP family metal transporter [Desulfobacterales bacterium]
MLILLACLAASADIIGGLIPFQPRFKNMSTRYALAFASGTVISAAFFELLPAADIQQNWAVPGIGFFAMYLIDKGLALHKCAESECEITGVTWVTILGMTSDNILDGAGIAVAYIMEPTLGIAVTLAVIAHELPQGMTTTLIMKAQGYRMSSIVAMLSLAGIMYPLGAVIGTFIPPAIHHAALAFVAGVFIYTGAAALMTEAHRHFNKSVIFFLLLGAVATLCLKLIEPH